MARAVRTWTIRYNRRSVQIDQSAWWCGRCGKDVPAIRAPLLPHFAELDERISAGWPDDEAALKAGGKNFAAHIYPGVNHGFHNDTTLRYDAEAAKLAEQRTIDYFKEYLL